MSRFPDKKVGEILGAGHVNDLNMAARMIVGSGQGSNISSFNGTNANPPPFLMQLVIVTEKRESQSQSQFDCDGANYKVGLRYYDPDSNTWHTNATAALYCMDASDLGDTLEVGDIVVAWWSAQRGAFIPGNAPPVSEGSVVVSGTCCCNEMDCLRIPGYSGIPDPEYYTFNLSGRFSCRCETGYSVVKLYDVSTDADDTVWESRHETTDNPISCLGTATQTVDCTNTATWEWQFGDPCAGDCYYRCSFDPAIFSFYWTATGSTCTSGCDCPDSEVGGSINGIPCNLGNNGLEETASGCVGNGQWVLISVDDSECSCTPDPPDYDGTVVGQTATTTCVGTKTVDGSDALFVSFWRLTIGTVYSGCDTTKLEFIIGTEVILTYYLETACSPHRPFCHTCTNTFKVVNCHSQCELGPTIICLKPEIPGAEIPACLNGSCDDDLIASHYFVDYLAGATITTATQLITPGGTVSFGIAGTSPAYPQSYFDMTFDHCGMILYITPCTQGAGCSPASVYSRTSGADCLQPMTFLNSSNGDIITLYPITTNIP